MGTTQQRQHKEVHRWTEKRFHCMTQVLTVIQVLDKSESKPKTIFDLRMLFQLELSIAGASRLDDNNSIGICATGVPNATMEICEEANNTAFNKTINTKYCSMISCVTESTTYIFPRHSKDSGKTLEKAQFSWTLTTTTV